MRQLLSFAIGLITFFAINLTAGRADPGELNDIVVLQRHNGDEVVSIVRVNGSSLCAIVLKNRESSIVERQPIPCVSRHSNIFWAPGGGEILVLSESHLLTFGSGPLRYSRVVRLPGKAIVRIRAPSIEVNEQLLLRNVHLAFSLAQEVAEGLVPVALETDGAKLLKGTFLDSAGRIYDYTPSGLREYGLNAAQRDPLDHHFFAHTIGPCPERGPNETMIEDPSCVWLPTSQLVRQISIYDIGSARWSLPAAVVTGRDAARHATIMIVLRGGPGASIWAVAEMHVKELWWFRSVDIVFPEYSGAFNANALLAGRLANFGESALSQDGEHLREFILQEKAKGKRVVVVSYSFGAVLHSFLHDLADENIFMAPWIEWRPPEEWRQDGFREQEAFEQGALGSREQRKALAQGAARRLSGIVNATFLFGGSDDRSDYRRVWQEIKGAEVILLEAASYDFVASSCKSKKILRQKTRSSGRSPLCVDLKWRKISNN